MVLSLKSHKPIYMWHDKCIWRMTCKVPGTVNIVAHHTNNMTLSWPDVEHIRLMCERERERDGESLWLDEKRVRVTRKSWIRSSPKLCIQSNSKRLTSWMSRPHLYSQYFLHDIRCSMCDALHESFPFLSNSFIFCTS